MSVIAATCMGLAAAIASAPEGATVQVTTDCPAAAPLLIRDRSTPLTIDGTGRQFPGGLWFFRVSNVTWRGGTVKASDGLYGINRRGYAMLAEVSGKLRIEGATVTQAFRGFTTIRSTGPIEIVSNRFVTIGGDGVNLAGDPAIGTLSGRVEGNVFEDIRPRRFVCRLPDGTQERPVQQTDCQQRGGIWINDHPDCVQMWGALDGIVVTNNRIIGGADCQGITTFGSASDRYKRISITRNLIHLADPEPNGIAFGNCTDCTVTHNDVRGANAYIRSYGAVPGLVMCGNSVTTTHPLKIAASGVQPCEEQSLTVRVIVPENVEVVVEKDPRQ